MVAVCTNISYNSNFDYHYHKQTMHFQLMNYTAETSSHKKTRFLLKQYTYHQQKQLMLKFFVHHSRVRKLYTSTIGDAGSEYNIEVKPMLTNYPTSELIDCQDSVTLFKEVGYRCFEWQYSVSLSGYSKYEDTHQVFSSNIKSTNMMSNDTNRNITLNVIFPPRRQWVMQEYKPVFQFYAFIAKIGGTLGLWTGASIVSFVHLVKLILSKLVASSDKV
uniref:Endoplasmic reticulum vesicle transporter C-terminal domain-containing protein n=1 Tax=Romanomermis culicivorax TaxID=13658 RepID=A0A915KXY0_ROMCU